MPFATLSLPVPATVGQLNELRHKALPIVAIDGSNGEYIEVIAWYHSDVAGLPGKEKRFSRIMDKDAAVEWGYIN